VLELFGNPIEFKNKKQGGKERGKVCPVIRKIISGKVKSIDADGGASYVSLIL
jgi:hypothetical protein